MTHPRPLHALLIDLDGTIADTHGLILQCYDHAVRTHLGQRGRRDLWEECVGLPLDSLLTRTFAHYGHTVTPEELEVIKQTYRAHMRENDGNITLFPGIRETLETFKANGLKLAVVTTKHRAMAERHLGHLGLTPLFDALVAGDECARYKPAPDPFLKALERLEVDASAAIGIGDSAHDIGGARAANLFAVAACWGTDNRPALLAAEPDALAERPADLLAFHRPLR